MPLTTSNTLGNSAELPRQFQDHAMNRYRPNELSSQQLTQH